MSAPRLRVLALTPAVLVAAAVWLASGSRAAGPGPITLPDLRILVPTNLISIGIDPSSGRRQLRFTHITADVGSGPFEIDPTFNSTSGVSTFVQAIYRSPSPGVWVLDHTAPVAAVGIWRPPSDYQFPLTRFTLNRVNADGSPGAIVAVSPKSDYCITGDTTVNGVANTPGQTYIPQADCTDPTKPLGWSVGWGDQYDQTDSGQPIDLSGVRSGTYVLHAEVDPRHVLSESNTSNDVTDTTIALNGDTVTVLGQSTPGNHPPSVRLTAPVAGATLAGTVTLRALATGQISSVQFLLDGQPLGRPVTRAPYAYAWAIGATAPGRHYLSAQASDAAGDMGTAAPVPVTVARAPQLHVRSVRWRAGVLSLVLSGIPRGGRVTAELTFRHAPARQLTIHRGSLLLHTWRPLLIKLRLYAAGHQIGAALMISLSARPTVSFINPTREQPVFGIVPLAAGATDSVGIALVQFSVDGHRIGRPIGAAPYAVEWDTRKLANGRHRLRVRVANVIGNSTTAEELVIVQNPAPPMTCFVLQAQRSAHGSGTVSTAPFATAAGGETLLAFVGGDGPAGAGRQTGTVTGGGVRWRLVARSNASSGDSEIWTATAPRRLGGARISAALGNPGFDVSLTVIAMEGADGVGASAAASGRAGAPSLRLKTLSSTSLVFATGNDWDHALPRGLPTGWVMLNQWLDQRSGDTYWSQYTNQPVPRAGTVVHVGTLAPTQDQWNLVAVELVGSG